MWGGGGGTVQCGSGWCGASTGRREVSFCRVVHISLSVTVRQTATNELISIFLTDISIHSMCPCTLLISPSRGKLRADASFRKRSPERTSNLSAPETKAELSSFPVS